jgi:hypothetical protein
VNGVWTVVQLRFIQSTTTGCISPCPYKEGITTSFSVIYDCILIYNVSINGKREVVNTKQCKYRDKIGTFLEIRNREKN